MQTINRVACAVLALSAPSIAKASDWQVINAHKHNLLFVDAESIQHRDGAVIAWSYYITRFPQTGGGKEFKTLDRYACTNGTQQTISFIVHDINGTLIHTDNTVGQITYPPPDSNSAIALKFVCKDRSIGIPLGNLSPRALADDYFSKY